MKLFKKITNLDKVKSFISVFIIFFLVNNLVANGSENKSDFLQSYNEDQFEETFFQNSIPFNSYDNLESQLKIFFGRDSNYPDLSIISSSDRLREIYRSKLNDMALNEIIYKMYK